ncbi:AMP-binding protein [Paralcaligenes ginsengisoli]
MEKPWLLHYPKDVPAEINTGNYSSLVDLLDQACKKHADRRALTLMGRSLLYRDLDRHADAVAAWIQQQGLPAGSRVALMMPNAMPYMVVFMGVLRAGMVAVNINPMYSERELEHQLQDCRPELIFILENFAATLAAVPGDQRPGRVVIVSLGDLLGLKGRLVDLVVRYVKRLIPPYSLAGALRFRAVLEQGAKAVFTRPVVAMDDLAVLQYTGGTTGVPKGAMLTHRNLVANVLQVRAVARPALGDLSGEPLTILSALPLYHIFALTVCGLFAVHAGMCSVLIVNPRDLSTIVQAWRRDPIHIFPAVNTLFNGLANRTEFAALDFSALRLCFGGGAAVQRAVAEKWQQITGKPLIEGYGLSETSPVVCVNPTDAGEYSGDIGFPLPSTDIVLFDNQEQPVALGEPGEVGIRGPQVMKGYWQRLDETAQSFTKDGFFKSGDIGIMSEQGRIRLVDRKKDMILVSGFNVYPSEIEEVVAAHPGVLECAAIGLPDARTGEMVKLYVVKKDQSLDERQLRDWCAERLAAYKRPHRIEFRTELPKSNVGKILRRALRDEASQGVVA